MIQFQKNITHHTKLGMSPYEATFGVKPRLGLSDALPPGVLDNEKIYTEEELEDLLQVSQSSSQTSTDEGSSIDESSISEQPSIGKFMRQIILLSSIFSSAN